MAVHDDIGCSGATRRRPPDRPECLPMRLRWMCTLAVSLLAACSTPTPTAPPTSAATSGAGGEPIAPADLLADFDALYAGLQAAHFDLYARRPKAEMDAAFARVRATLDAPMTRDAAQLVFQRFVAEGRVAHARIDLPFDRWAAHRARGGRALPLFLRVQDGHVFARDIPVPVDGASAGDEVVAVDDRPALEWLDGLGQLVSADTDYMRHAQVERLVPMLAWLVHGETDGVKLTLRTPEASLRTVFLPSRTRAEVEAAQATPAAEPPSRALRRFDDGIAWLRPGPFYDDRPEAETPWDVSAFRAFIDGAFTELLAAGSTDLVIDLRDNPGGDNSFSDLMLAWIADRPFRFSPGFEIRVSEATVASNRARLDGLPAGAGGASAEMAALFEGRRPGEIVVYPIPEVAPRTGGRFTGRVHVLINRHTYSNAANVAAVIQDYRFGRVLGEETSDLASTLGAMEQFTLPCSGLVVGYPKARILRPSGDPTPRGVVPDVILPSPVAESDGDAVMDAVLARLRAEASTGAVAARQQTSEQVVVPAPEVVRSARELRSTARGGSTAKTLDAAGGPPAGASFAAGADTVIVP